MCSFGKERDKKWLMRKFKKLCKLSDVSNTLFFTWDYYVRLSVDFNNDFTLTV